MEDCSKATIVGLSVSLLIVLIAGVNIFLSYLLLMFGFANGIFELALLFSNPLGLVGAFWLSYLGRVGLGILAVLGVLPLSFGLTAAVGDEQRANWREEAVLSSGEIVVVSRAETRLRSGGHTRFFVSGGATILSEIRFPDSKASWRGGSGERPMALDMSDGRYLIAVRLGSEQSCLEYFYPTASVIYLRWNGERWERMFGGGYPVGGKANLLQNPWGDGLFDSVNGLVKNAEKELTTQNNGQVNQPLEKVLSDRSRDACAMYRGGRN